jgi:hypothetical protein
VQVDYLILADAAAAADGKLYIHGAGWDTIYASAFPTMHPSIAVAIRWRVPWNDTNQQHEAEIDIIDADGDSILPNPPGPPRGTWTVGRPPHLTVGSDQTFPTVIQLVGLSFPRPGAYVLVVRLDGQDVAQSPFNLAFMPGAQQPPAPQPQ